MASTVLNHGISGGGGITTSKIVTLNDPCEDWFAINNHTNGSLYVSATHPSVVDNRIDYRNFTGADFKADDVLYPSSFVVSQDHNLFHFKVWHSIYGDSFQDYGFSTTFPSIEPRVTFNSVESRDLFEEWLKVYRKLYDGKLTEKLPQPPSHPVKGTVMPRCVDHWKEETLIEIMAWVFNSCIGRVYFMLQSAIFEDENDALAFRMRFQ